VTIEKFAAFNPFAASKVRRSSTAAGRIKAAGGERSLFKAEHRLVDGARTHGVVRRALCS
jgi:hypothetical protein